jgi:hypothetical protein
VNLQRAVLVAGAASDAQLRESYLRAVLEGAANTQCTAREECCCGTVRLLTLAALRLPDLTLYAHWAQVCDDSCDARARRVLGVVLRAVADLACGALRLAHRALEHHCHDLDDRPGAWVARAIDCARQRLHEHPGHRDFDPGEVGVALGLARLAMLSLTRAIAATVDDPRLVCEQLADGLGHLFAVYLIARQAGGGS